MFCSEPVENIDNIYLLWVNRRACGFITLRPCWDAFPQHDFDIVDTVFLQKSSRGQGYVTQFIQTKLLQNEDLAFSQPISNKMLKSLLKFLKQNQEFKERIWIVDQDLEEKQILWWSAAKIARQRNLDLKTMLTT